MIVRRSILFGIILLFSSSSFGTETECKPGSILVVERPEYELLVEELKVQSSLLDIDVCTAPDTTSSSNGCLLTVVYDHQLGLLTMRWASDGRSRVESRWFDTEDGLRPRWQEAAVVVRALAREIRAGTLLSIPTPRTTPTIETTQPEEQRLERHVRPVSRERFSAFLCSRATRRVRVARIGGLVSS
jgi:hypothetical protein